MNDDDDDEEEKEDRREALREEQRRFLLMRQCLVQIGIFLNFYVANTMAGIGKVPQRHFGSPNWSARRKIREATGGGGKNAPIE